MTQRRRHMVVDTANLLFRTSSAHTKYSTGSDEEKAGLALHVALNTLKSHYNKIKPDVVAITFEGRENWRKAYTKSDACISQRIYKANRVKDDSLIPFYTLMEDFEGLVRAHTSIICLQHPKCEGDDMFTAYAERFCGEGDEVFGLSGDKDYIQLLDLPNFTLLNPDKLGGDRSLDKKGNLIDAKFFMFEKAFRGDTGDNVMSAYPRLRSTKIEKAYTSEYDLTNLLNETWTFVEPSTGEERIMRVGDLFEENQLLMNLRRQPDEIRALMAQAVQDGIDNAGKFSLFHFAKFCGKHQLKKIGDDSASFAPMFSNRGFYGNFRQDLLPENQPQKPSAPVEIEAPTERDQQNSDIMARMRERSKLKSTLVF